MPLTQEERDAIIDAANNKTKDEFAEEVAKRTALSTKEVVALGRTDEDRKALAEMVAAVTAASKSNAEKAQAVRNIAGGVEALVKVASLFL